jgi:hypothetical protein
MGNIKFDQLYPIVNALCSQLNGSYYLSECVHTADVIGGRRCG